MTLSSTPRPLVSRLERFHCITQHVQNIYALVVNSANSSPSTGAAVVPAGTFDSDLPTVLTEVACSGSESSLLECNFSTSSVPGDCDEPGAAIVCQGRTHTHTHTCIQYNTHTVETLNQDSTLIQLVMVGFCSFISTKTSLVNSSTTRNLLLG